MTEQQAAFSSDYESELSSSVHPRAAERPPVEIKASHAGTVSLWTDTGLVRSAEARNKSWPFLVLLGSRRSKHSLENLKNHQCMAKKRQKRCELVKEMFENSPVLATGQPETLLSSAQNTSMSKCREGEHKLRLASSEVETCSAAPAERTGLAEPGRHCLLGSTQSNNRRLLTRTGNAFDSRTASGPPARPPSVLPGSSHMLA